MLNNIRIVLINTTHSGNIGASARAMKTMGLAHLYLVNPRSFPDDKAVARAAGATDILDNARVVNNLDAAINDCTLVLGASARRRSIKVSTLNPHTAADWVAQQYQQRNVAILFGRESDGLTNDELDRCQRLITIPANSDYSSLNIAAAVQVIAYELRMRFLHEQMVEDPITPEAKPTANELDGLWQHLTATLTATEFINPAHPGLVMRKLQRMFQRADLSAVEVSILRGVLSSMDKKMKKL